MIIIPMAVFALAKPNGQVLRLTFMSSLLVNESLLLLFDREITVRFMVIGFSTFSLCLNYFSLRKMKCSIFLTWMEVCLLIVMRLTHLYANQLATAIFDPENSGRMFGAKDLMCVEVVFLHKISQACLGAIGHIYLYLKLYSIFLSTTTTITVCSPI